MSRGKKKVFQWMLKSLGLGIFIFICFQIDFESVVHSLIHSNPHHIVFAVLTLILFHLTKGIRLFYLLKFGDMHIPVFQCYLIYIIGLYWGLITPGRMGDLVKAYHIKDHGYAFVDGVSVTIVDRLLDMMIFFLFSGFGLVYLFLKHAVVIQIPCWMMIVLAGLCLFLLMLCLNRKFLYRNFYKLPLVQKIHAHFLSFKSYVISLISLKRFVFLFIFTIISWFIYLTVVQNLIIAMGLHLNFLTMMVFFFLSTLVSFLPISYAGIGTRDAVLVFLFNLYDYAGEDAIRFSFSILFIYICTITMGFVANFLKKSPELINNT